MVEDCNYKKISYKGFTLIEIVVVIGVLAVLAGVAVATFSGYVEMAREAVCKANCLGLERMYEGYLELEGLEHSDVVFQQFLKEYGKEICPCRGEISYLDGKVRCSVHDEDEGDVPFL